MPQDEAGHSDISTTSNIYVHVDAAQKLEAAQALQEAFANDLLPSLLPTLGTPQLTN
jgi:hypothetical protein